MMYEITVNEIEKANGNIRGFASVVLENSFLISNIAIVEGKNGELFISMPRYASSREESGYKDVCHPITKDFREELYGEIQKAFDQVQKMETKRLHTKVGDTDAKELKFNIKTVPFEREGSNLKGLARIYFNDCFVVNNVSLLQGKNGLFVAMPSYKTKQVDEQGKSIYQDICFPVTKEFREKLYGALMNSFQQEKEKQQEISENKAQSSKMVTTYDGQQVAVEDTPFR